MNRLNCKIYTVVFCLCLAFGSMAQIKNYKFSRELKDVTNQWHSITLPDEIYGKLENQLHDIRIYGLDENDSLFEVPYVFRSVTESGTPENLIFKRINESKNNRGFFFVFEVSKLAEINDVDLEFSDQNFDWLVDLEGSQEQTDWFTIIEDYRILSIKNDLTNYQFTKLKFQKSKYKYYRLLVKSKAKPELTSAQLQLDVRPIVLTQNVKTSNFKITHDKLNKRSIVQINLEQAVPISLLKINVLANYDYFRPIIIKYVTDSVKSGNSWVYSYTDVVSGTLSSLENNEFSFSGNIAKSIQVIIENQDNISLNISDVVVKGVSHVLSARFDQKGQYFLCYGNPNALKPNYDIEQFTANIPKNITEIALGKEVITKQIEPKVSRPLFENKLWLWVVISVTIGLMAWVTLRMMRNRL